MRRTSFENWNCSVARTLQIIGDWWTMMIVREAFYGTRTFGGFEKRLGISKNILSCRLNKMEADGLLERRQSLRDARSYEYRLTKKGRSLFAVLIAMMQWGDEWVDDGSGAPIILTHKKSGDAIAALETKTVDGKEVRPRELHPLPGPGADAATCSRFSRSSPARHISSNQ